MTKQELQIPVRKPIYPDRMPDLFQVLNGQKEGSSPPDCPGWGAEHTERMSRTGCFPCIVAVLPIGGILIEPHAVLEMLLQERPHKAKGQTDGIDDIAAARSQQINYAPVFCFDLLG